MKTKRRKPDKYDETVAYLTRYPKRIQKAWERWNDPRKPVKGACLFDYVTSNRMAYAPNGVYCGCLTTIKGCGENAQTLALRKAIIKDDRIPTRSDKITVESLPVFAEWQRKIDKILKRK